MTTSQNDPNRPVMDEVDDLTRFLDEDFGTDEVDLFEFTSGEEVSPLTQLKTIVLGLDWEITDESLQDLSDEIETLRNEEQFLHDKVSQVYLQALDKIGNYILSEGAYAHPNAIKLLLSMFYDFEKITSSDLITGAEITALLKSDVRKFKILQYQIAQKHGATVPEAAAAAAELPLTDHKTLLDIHAAILELDWDVSDEGLDRMSEQLNILRDQFADNRYIQIIIRGLTTLNKYIDDERARTHPEAFSLLHHFFEALETLVDDKELDEEKSQKILISCVNRLNGLKALITQTPQVLEEDAIVPVYEGEVVPDEAGLPAEEAAPETQPDAGEEKPAAAAAPLFAPPTAKEEEYVDELDVELPVDEGGEVAPALFDEDEESGFGDVTEAEEAPPEELTEKLAFFFDDEEAVPPPPSEEEVLEMPVDEDIAAEEPAAETAPAAPAFPPPAADEEYVDELDVELPVDEGGEVAPALFDEEEESGFGDVTEAEEAPPEELEEKLQFFFGEEEETFEPEAIEDKVAREKEEEEELAAEELKELEEEEEILSIAPALAGEPDESGFTADEAEAEAPPEGLEEKLEFFFGDREEAPQQPEPAPEKQPIPSEEGVPEALFEEDEEELLLTGELPAEEAIPAGPAESASGISTQEEFNTAAERMRAEFKEREQSLMDEIALLKAEIESLRSQLQ